MSQVPTSKLPTVIVGGGFVGLFTALHLSHHKYPRSIILIDPQDRFVFKPLLFEYLTGEMQENQVFPRYSELLQGSNVQYIQDSVTAIDLKQKSVELAYGAPKSYEYLVLGVGSSQGYFGTAGARENSLPFRTREDAIKLENHLRVCLQNAVDANEEQKKELLTFVIVGAGPSGVEMAATLGDLLPEWYSKIGGKGSDIRIVLVNHGKEILEGDINSHLQVTALEALKHRTAPVELLLGARVLSVHERFLEYTLDDEEQSLVINAATTIWTAGTSNNPLLETLALPDEDTDHHHKPLVSSSLQLINFPNVFAAGDCATVQSSPQPPVAQIAYQQGTGIARELNAALSGQRLQPIEAHLRGTLMKLGIRNGIANLFDKVKVNNTVGDAIRTYTYLELLPTPLHNFKATSEWLTDEIFERHNQHSLNISSSKGQSEQHPIMYWAIGIIVLIAIVIGLIYSLQIFKSSPDDPHPSPQERTQ